MVSGESRVYLLRVDEVGLSRKTLSDASRSCEWADCVRVERDRLKMAHDEQLSHQTAAVWAVNLHIDPLQRLDSRLRRRFKELSGRTAIHCMDIAVSRNPENGWMDALVRHEKVQIYDPVRHAAWIEQMEEGCRAYSQMQIEEFEEEQLIEQSALQDAEEETNEWLTQWEQAWSDEIEPFEEPDASDDLGTSFDASDENVSSVVNTDAHATDLFTRLDALASELRQLLGQRSEFNAERLTIARRLADDLRIEMLLQSAKIDARRRNEAEHLLGANVLRPRHARCFRCAFHLYDHLDLPCTKCHLYQIICPKCGAHGCNMALKATGAGAGE